MADAGWIVGGVLWVLGGLALAGQHKGDLALLDHPQQPWEWAGIIALWPILLSAAMVISGYERIALSLRARRPNNDRREDSKDV